MADANTETPPEPPSNGSTRVTINLGRRAVTDLDALCGEWDANRTDAINRAIALALLVVQLGDGRSLRVVTVDGTTERIHVL